MKIHLRKGQTTTIVTVRSPRGEIFQLPLEVVSEDSMPLMPKTNSIAVGDVQAYSNWEDERFMEQTRSEIRRAAEKLKNPQSYSAVDGYNNLMAIEHNVGASSPKISSKQKESGFV